MYQKIAVFTIYLTACIALADTNPSNTYKIGDGANTVNKSFIFNKGSSNPSLRWNTSTSKVEVSNDNSTFSPINPMTAVGDIIIGGTSGKATALPVGGNGTILGVVSGSPAYVASPTLPPGMLVPFAGSSCPTQTVLADGSSQLRAGTYANLFAAIGTTYGSVDGTHFNFPDSRGVFVRGAGTNAKILEANGGSYTATLGAYSTDLTQGHRHTYSQSNGDALWAADGSGASSTSGWVASGSGSAQGWTVSLTILNPSTDGTNGTPRSGAETAPANLAITYCIAF